MDSIEKDISDLEQNTVHNLQVYESHNSNCSKIDKIKRLQKIRNSHSIQLHTNINDDKTCHKRNSDRNTLLFPHNYLYEPRQKT